MLKINLQIFIFIFLKFTIFLFFKIPHLNIFLYLPYWFLKIKQMCWFSFLWIKTFQPYFVICIFVSVNIRVVSIFVVQYFFFKIGIIDIYNERIIFWLSLSLVFFSKCGSTFKVLLILLQVAWSCQFRRGCFAWAFISCSSCL